MRQTGKSFRAVLQALIYASKGEHVLYICNTHQDIPYYMHMALNAIEGINGVDKYRDRLEFRQQNLGVKGGSIRFLSYRQYHADLNGNRFRGIKFTTIRDLHINLRTPIWTDQKV